MLHHLTHIWAEPDEGLWAVRGGARHFTHSTVMAWVAFDGGIEAIEPYGLNGLIDQWRAVRAAIHHDVCPRVCGTIEAVERRLLVDGFLLRYDPTASDDGLPGTEGAFLACSFWLADAYSLSGRVADARRLFERLLSLCNDVGLLSEEYDPASRRLVGNYPQAFSDIALVNTAHNLARATKPAEQRSAP
jgi:GH15 family glucan-1,4-alpha-glucosidase